jgi:hypothetical protein
MSPLSLVSIHSLHGIEPDELTTALPRVAQLILSYAGRFVKRGAIGQAPIVSAEERYFVWVYVSLASLLRSPETV